MDRYTRKLLIAALAELKVHFGECKFTDTGECYAHMTELQSMEDSCIIENIRGHLEDTISDYAFNKDSK